MKVLDRDRQVRVLHALCEGNSVNATANMTGVGKPTILRLLVALGQGCDRLHRLRVRDVRSASLQCDEAAGCVAKSQRRERPPRPGGRAGAYVFTATDANSRLIVSYLVGTPDAQSARLFLDDLRARLAPLPRPRIATDGFAPCVEAVLTAGGGALGDAEGMKRALRSGGRDGEPLSEPQPEPDPFLFLPANAGADGLDRAPAGPSQAQGRASRAHVRQITQLCDAFRTKAENYRAALALHIAYASMVRPCRAIKTVPAVAAGILRRPLTLDELLDLALSEPDAPALAPERTGPRVVLSARRELPNGRGWLRVIDGGRGSAAPEQVADAPTARPPQPHATTRRWEQLTLWDALRGGGDQGKTPQDDM